MKPDLRQFFTTTNPGRTLNVEKEEDRQYYIDFSSVRGGAIVEKIKQRITFFSPDEPTCTLFTGHIGCGKSTELLRLKTELEKDGFLVIYFESDEDLEMADVDIADVFLAIARRIARELEVLNLAEPQRFKALIEGATRVLQAEILGLKGKIPGVGDVGYASKDDKFSLSFGIGELTAQVKSDAGLREKLNQYLGPQTSKLLDAINSELLEPAIAALRKQGKRGLVAIVDNLDRIDNLPKPSGRPQQEYLFIDRGEWLTKLHCHVLYTMPLGLKFSNNYGMLTQRFEDPRVLPMVSVQQRDGSDRTDGLELLRRMVLVRGVPELAPEFEAAACETAIAQMFDCRETLDRLCRISGGHVRDLLKLLNSWIQEEMALPLTRKTLEIAIRGRYNDMVIPISDAEWELLREVQRRKKVRDEEGYQKLIRSRFVFEYRDGTESWFDVNPILAEGTELRD
ncbi:MAG: ATP-binding protein [Cyanobacteriota bacterium]|nr:ATP-binding protein [Cyanobacteriota bacterium]